MSTVGPDEAVNGCTEERKQIRRMKYFIVYLYIVYTYLCRGGRNYYIGVAELGLDGVLGTEIVEKSALLS